MKLIFRPIDSTTWQDFEALMESKGSPHNCWCTAWVKVDSKAKKIEKAEKKAAIKARIDAGIPVGLLAYDNDEAFALCALAPRDTYKKLGGDESKEGVWSVVCFFIKRSYRGQGLSHKLLTEAIEFASRSGAIFVEAYPVDPDSPSYRFMGFKPGFEKAGFEFQKMAGSRRHVMWKALECG